MDNIQRFLVKAGRKDLAQEYFEKFSNFDQIKRNIKELIDFLKPLKENKSAPEPEKLSADEEFQRGKKFQQLSKRILDLTQEAIEFLGRENLYNLRTVEDLDRLYQKRIAETRQLEQSERSRRSLSASVENIDEAKRKLQEFLKKLEQEL